MKQKKIHLALQGGGAHGAFTWGILDYILEDGRLNIDGICASSAGSMNAAVLAYGRLKGGNEGAREALNKFWTKVSQNDHLVAEFPRPIIDFMTRYYNYNLFDGLTRFISPYQFNSLNINPLKKIIEAQVDFEELRKSSQTRLFINATNVKSGKIKVFGNDELSSDVIMASACLPYLFQAQKVGEDYFWDGGFSGNPALFPLYYLENASSDIIIVHINPIDRDTVPFTANEISNRINEVTFNCPLLHEFRAIAFVNKMLDSGWIKDEYANNFRRTFVHSIRADHALRSFDVASKFDTHWYFLTYLRDLGREEAKKWIDENFDNIGKKSTVDLYKDFLGDKHTTGI